MKRSDTDAYVYNLGRQVVQYRVEYIELYRAEKSRVNKSTLCTYTMQLVYIYIYIGEIDSVWLDIRYICR